MAWKLYYRGIECHALSVKMPDSAWHHLLIYQYPTGELFAYSAECGSKPLGRIGWGKNRIAEAYCPGCTNAQWITSPLPQDGL